MARYKVRARAIGEDEADEQYVAFEETEGENDVVILAAPLGECSWCQFALRHADRYFLLARRDARPPRPFPLTLEGTAGARKFRLVDLVMIEEGRTDGTIADWVDAVGANRIFHWSGEASMRRLARVMAGKSIGLVLSGGGARAYAHIGALKAMRELGLPIDFISGASMGAIVGACAAMGWTDQELEERIRDAFVRSNPLGDHVLPVVALTRGKLVEERLKKHFGDALIEEMQTPFLCVSSDLAGGVAKVHRLGRVRDALRATISLPGILPPVVENGALLVDGAVIDNFPLDLMAAAHRGQTIGIDVALRGTINPQDFVNPPGFLQWIWEHGFRTAPPIVSLLMRAATAREEPSRTTHPADIMIVPTIAGVELRDWKKYDVAVAAGYQATKAALEERWADLGPIAEADRPA
jgi:NTE family protein